MRTLIIILFGLLVSAVVTPIQAATTPTTIELKVYQVAVSTDPLCTDPQTIFKTSSPVFVDFVATPTLGSGDIPTGTYKCVIIEIASTVKFKPLANDGVKCVAGQEVSMPICSGGDYTGKTYTLLDGTTGDCSGTSERRVPLVLSTASSCVGTGPNCDSTAFPFGIPTDASGTSKNGLHLANALVVSGDKTANFTVNGKDQVSDQGSKCVMEAPVFSFSGE